MAQIKRNLRCNKKSCGHRFGTRSQKATDLIKCPVCKSNVRDDGKNIKAWNKKFGLCNCDGLHFSMKGAPHRKGSKWCEHYQGEYDEEDFLYQQAQMAGQ